MPRKKIYIIISSVIGLILLCLMVYLMIFKNSFYHFTPNGKAAFYNITNYNLDSTLNKLNNSDLANRLSSNIINNCDFNSTQVVDYYNDVNCIINNKKTLKKDRLFLSVVEEKNLYKLSVVADSLYFIAPQLANSINDSLLLIQYYNYQAGLLKKLNINSMVLFFDFPLVDDSIKLNKVINNLIIKLQALHNNNMLTIVNLDETTKFNINNDVCKKIVNALIQAKLCGFIVSNIEQIDFVEQLGFDGLIINNSKLDKTPDKNHALILNSDFTIVDSAFNKIELVNEEILKVNSRKKMLSKLAKLYCAILWASHDEGSNNFLCLDINLLKKKISELSTTILKNNHNIIPLNDINKKIHIICDDKNMSGAILSVAKNYSSQITISFIDTSKSLAPIKIPNDINILLLFANYQSDSNLNYIKDCFNNFKQVKIFVNYGELSLSALSLNVDAFIQIYNKDNFSIEYATQIIYGAVGATGTLGISLDNIYDYGYGFITSKTRLNYCLPDTLEKFNLKKLKDIDSIVYFSIANGIMPGCQIFIAKDGYVVYNKAFGHHDYSKRNNVKIDDYYDVASLTKICATTIACMKMKESGKLDIDNEIGKYFKNKTINYKNIKSDTVVIIDTINFINKSRKEIDKIVKGKDTLRLNDSLMKLTELIITKTNPSQNIFKVPIRSLLLHKSGISPSLPILRYMFYEDSYAKYLRSNYCDTILCKDTLLDKKKFKKRAFEFYYSKNKIKDSAELQIAESMFLLKRWQDTLYEDIKRLGTFARNNYQYTDMNMILIQMIIDTINNKTLDNYLKKEFYYNLGMTSTTFKPLNNKVSKNKIIPTEDESFWRNQLIHGTVHDPSAAMLGGISGNAGLFSSAKDLGVLSQMLLNGGSYGGVQYLKRTTVSEFSSKQEGSHRGLGFDIVSLKNINAKSAPPTTFGHTGFTGCALWIDPENKIVFVFLSNRIHPKIKKNKGLSFKILRDIHEVVYQAIDNGEDANNKCVE